MIKTKHFEYIFITILFFFLQNCQFKEPLKTHGINYLENRYNILEINKTNSNDVIKLLGQPHTKSIKNESDWFYFERTITRGEFQKLGRNILKENNVLALRFDKFGILQDKEFLDKQDMNNISYSTASTENVVRRSSFINNFLSSIKEKMYSNRRSN